MEKLSLNTEWGISQEQKFVPFTSKTKPDLQMRPSDFSKFFSTLLDLIFIVSL
jgi:hypothetical protein